MTTKADEKLAEVREHVKQAAATLSEILFGDVYGADDFTPTFKAQMLVALIRLAEAKERLG